MIAVTISLDTLTVSMPCSSNWTLTPSSFSSRTAARQSFVFLAKREIDLTRIRSILPFRQSRIIRWKSSRFSTDVPVMPSSAAVQKGLINLRRTGFPAQGLHQSFDLIDKVQSNVHAPIRVDGDGLQQLSRNFLGQRRNTGIALELLNHGIVAVVTAAYFSFQLQDRAGDFLRLRR